MQTTTSNEKRITPWQRTRDVAVSQRRLRRAASCLEGHAGAAARHEAATLRELERVLTQRARAARRAGERLTEASRRRNARRRAARGLTRLAWSVVGVATSTVGSHEPRVLPKRHLKRVRELLSLEGNAQQALARAELSMRAAAEEELAARRGFLAALFDARAAIAHAQAVLARLGLKVTNRPPLVSSIVAGRVH
jgi:hypothetical protein